MAGCDVSLHGKGGRRLGKGGEVLLLLLLVFFFFKKREALREGREPGWFPSNLLVLFYVYVWLLFFRVWFFSFSSVHHTIHGSIPWCLEVSVLGDFTGLDDGISGWGEEEDNVDTVFGGEALSTRHLRDEVREEVGDGMGRVIRGSFFLALYHTDTCTRTGTGTYTTIDIVM
jgi:hypothetical protein